MQLKQYNKRLESVKRMVWKHHSTHAWTDHYTGERL